MNYNMQGMTKTIPELFAMLKSTKVEIKKKHQVLMVNKTTSFKKKGKGKKGNSRKNVKQVVTPVKKPKAGPKPETECFYYKAMVTGSGTAPSIWRIRRMLKWTNVYVIYMSLMCTLLMLVVAPGYLILVRLLIFVTRNRSYGLNEDWLRMRWQCASGMVPRSMWSPSAATSTFTYGISFKPQ